MLRGNKKSLGAKEKTKAVSKPEVKAGPKLVLIEWVDAVTEAGWEVGKGHCKVDLVYSVGYLLSKNDTEIILAADVSPDRENQLHTNRRLAIPSQWIKDIKEITV